MESQQRDGQNAWPAAGSLFSRKCCYKVLFGTNFVCWLLMLQAIGLFEVPDFPRPPRWALIVVGIPVVLVAGFFGLVWMVIMGQAVEVLDKDTRFLASKWFPRRSERALKWMQGIEVAFFSPLVLGLFGGISSLYA